MNKTIFTFLVSLLAISGVHAAAQASATVSLDAIRGRAATVSFADLDAATTNSLVFVWGGANATGDTPEAWPNRLFGGLVRPGDTTRTVTLPEMVTGNVRAFLVEGVWNAPADYVADGLINQWDGIDNAGTGTHDASATVWKDKVGGLDLLLTPKGAWNAAGNGLAVSGLSATGTVATAAYRTIEILFTRHHGAIGNYVFSSGVCTSASDGAARLVVNMGSAVQFSGCEFAPVLSVVPDTVVAGAATYVVDSVESIYQDGLRARRPVTYYESWSCNVKAVTIGGRPDGRYGWSQGTVYAIRLYDRVLTAAEIAANHRLDAVRFLGVPPGSAVLATSDVKNCAKGVSVVATGFDVAGRPTNVTVAFQGVTSPCDLVMAWGSSDAGADPASWPNRIDLGVVEPEDETCVVELPTGWGGASAAHVRFFLKAGVDAPADYVGNGIITWLDGIDNAGTGTHDPSATVWKDKAGALDFALTNSASWNAAGNALVCDGISAVADNSAAAYRTIEAVYRSTRSGGRVVFMPNYHQTGKNTWDSSRVLVDGGASEYTYFEGIMDRPIHLLSFPYDSSRIRCVAGVYDDQDAVMYVARDGRRVTSPAYYNNWGFGTAGATIGGRVNPKGIYPWYGELHALRLHTGALTEAQLLANLRLDLVRFCGAARDTAIAAVSAGVTYAEGMSGEYGAETIAAVAEKDGLRVDLRDGVRVIEWRKQLLPFTYSPSTVTDFTSAYVQDGLINWWDGLDNAGLGAFNPSATTWKDKKGSINLYLTKKGTWNAAQNALSVSGLSATGRVATAAYRTIDTAFKMTGGRILFASGCADGRSGALNSRFIVFDEVSGALRGYFDGTKSTRYLPWTKDSTALRTMTGVYNASHTVAHVYGNGVENTSGGELSNTWNTNKDRVSIGNRDETTKYDWSGEVYAIRLYNRELTSAEIANNHALDLYRFSGDGSAPAGQFAARITLVQVTGEGEDVLTWATEVPGTAKTLIQSAETGEVEWYAKRGVWKATFELLFGTEQFVFHTETQIFDLRDLGAAGCVITIR